jgi:hypothetical protein
MNPMKVLSYSTLLLLLLGVGVGHAFVGQHQQQQQQRSSLDHHGGGGWLSHYYHRVVVVSGGAPPPSYARTTSNTCLFASSSPGSRREVVQSAALLSLSLVVALMKPPVAHAGIDPNMLKNLPVEGDASGAAMRLRQLEADRVRPEDTQEIPYTELNDGGVKYRDYRSGKGDAVVQAGSKVAVEMTIRCQSFSTNVEPGGVKYYSTKDDTEFNEFAFTVGSGEVLPELEEGMMGMKKGGLRRIIVPSVQVFTAKRPINYPYLPPRMECVALRVYSKRMRHSCSKSWSHE